MRSILSLSQEELQKIYDLDLFPEDVNLEGIDKHPNFEKLFRYRNNPRGLANLLILKKEKPVKDALAADRLAIREKELRVKEAKIAKLTNLEKKIDLLNQKVDLLLKEQYSTIKKGE